MVSFYQSYTDCLETVRRLEKDEGEAFGREVEEVLALFCKIVLTGSGFYDNLNTFINYFLETVDSIDQNAAWLVQKTLEKLVVEYKNNVKFSSFFYQRKPNVNNLLIDLYQRQLCAKILRVLSQDEVRVQSEEALRFL